jgi:hypothetical protein
VKKKFIYFILQCHKLIGEQFIVLIESDNETWKIELWAQKWIYFFLIKFVHNFNILKIHQHNNKDVLVYCYCMHTFRYSFIHRHRDCNNSYGIVARTSSATAAGDDVRQCRYKQKKVNSSATKRRWIKDFF